MAGGIAPGHGRSVDVVVVGSANIDLIARVPRAPRPGETLIATEYGEHPGGKGLNQAVAAAKHARTALVAQVGTDNYGDLLVDFARERSVDASGVVRSSEPTGRALITLQPDGENTIIVAPLANMRMGAADVRRALTGIRAAIALVQFEILPEAVEAVAAWCADSGARLVINPSPMRAVSPDLLARADPLLVNAGEAADILRFEGEPADLARELSQRCASVVVTAGAGGAYAAVSGDVRTVPAPRVRAHDSSGAGDAFAGMLCARLARGADLVTAVGDAVTEASRVVATPREQR